MIWSTIMCMVGGTSIICKVYACVKICNILTMWFFCFVLEEPYNILYLLIYFNKIILYPVDNIIDIFKSSKIYIY